MRTINLDSLDLKAERLKSGVTQEILGKRIGKSQSVVARMEADPKSLTLELLKLWLEACGNFSHTDDLHISSFKLDRTIKRSLEVTTAIETNLVGIANTEAILQHLNRRIRVPFLVFIGPVDAGKSTTINSVLGAHILPASWAPTTKSLTILRHTCRRPEHLKGTTFLLGPEFTIDQIDDRISIEKNTLRSGDSTLLQEFEAERIEASPWGEISGVFGHGRKPERKQTTIIHYADNAVLLHCDLVDTPGFGTSETDNALAAEGMLRADVVVSCHAVGGFMGSQSLEATRASIELLNQSNQQTDDALQRLIILITHAAQDVSDDSLFRLREKAVLDLESCLPKGFFRNSFIASRFFPFHPTISARNKDFRGELKFILEEVLPTAISKEFNEALAAIISNMRAALMHYQSTASESHPSRRELEAYILSQKELRRSHKARITVQLEEARLRVHDEWSKIYSGLTNREYVEAYIKKHFQQEKDVDKVIVSKLQSEASRQITAAFNQHLYSVRELDSQLAASFRCAVSNTTMTPFEVSVALPEGSTAIDMRFLIAAIPLTLVLPLALGIAASGIALWRGLGGSRSWQTALAERVVEAFKGSNINASITQAIEESLQHYQKKLEQRYGLLSSSHFNYSSLDQAEQAVLTTMTTKTDQKLYAQRVAAALTATLQSISQE